MHLQASSLFFSLSNSHFKHTKKKKKKRKPNLNKQVVVWWELCPTWSEHCWLMITFSQFHIITQNFLADNEAGFSNSRHSIKNQWHKSSRPVLLNISAKLSLLRPAMSKLMLWIYQVLSANEKPGNTMWHTSSTILKSHWLNETQQHLWVVDL